MTRLRHVTVCAFLLSGMGVVHTSFGQGNCQNATLYPAGAITAGAVGTPVTISTCSFQSEYSQVTGIVAGTTYEFGTSLPTYVTLRSGAPAGPVVAQGFAPLFHQATAATDLYPHWTVNENCATATGCITTTVTALSCTPPSVTWTYSENCDFSEFYIDVDVAATGSGSTVNIVWEVFGVQSELAGVGVGVYQLGPFIFGDEVLLVVEHESDPVCNRDFGVLDVFSNCPVLVGCGGAPIASNYCYDINDNRSWLYQSAGSGSLILYFTGGTIQTFGETLRIYDGVDNTGALLYQFAGTDPDLSSIFVISTTGSIFMEMTSDGFGSCVSGATTEWNWEVNCLNCTYPQTTFEVVQDCPNEQWSLAVDVLGTGDGTSVNLNYSVNGGGALSEAGVGVGVTVLGPFSIGDVVDLEVAHEFDSFCNQTFTGITDPGTCATLVECGTELNAQYCHGENENYIQYYQGTGAFPIALSFNSGSLETCCDDLFVYDGADITAPLLTPVAGTTGDLTGLFFVSTNPENRLTFRVTTDGSVSCQSGSQQELNWTVSCLDCIAPQATFEIVQDCENFQYFIAVDIASLGSDTDLEIANDYGLASTFVTVAGEYQIGPFESGVPVQLQLVNDANSLCSVNSPVLVNPLCPQSLCGATPSAEQYCYTNNENRAWAYEVPVGSTIRLIFQRGTIESNTWDDLIIYDGPSNAPGTPILFEHTNTTTWNLGPQGSAVNSTVTNFYAVDVTTTGNTLYMTLTSDGSVQCNGNTTFDSFQWTAQCLGCQAPGVAYNLVADCIARTYVAEVIVTQTPGANGLEIVNESTGEDSVVTAPGVYVFGPYAQNDTTVFGITDLANTTCTFISDSLTYSSDDCIISTCQVLTTDLCYANNEDRWYTYQSIENVPMTVAFEQGQMLTGDRIVVYNGFDETATVIYQGANGGNLAGFAVNSQNPNNVITLRIQSNNAGSCADGAATVPLRWAVGCGAVGIDEASSEGFSVYPNPTRDLLTIAMGGNVSGDVLVRVLDMSGRVVLESPYVVKGGGSNTISLAGLQTGQYMIQLNTDNWVKTQRVQVAR
jgi:hypothetical protein